MDDIKSRLNPYDYDYASCDLTLVKLIVYTSDLDPLEITRQLEIEPTSCCKAGDKWVSGRGIILEHPFSVWILSSENEILSKDTRHHLDWLLQILERKVLILKDIQNHPGVTMTISCVWWSNQGHGGPVLWPEQMLKLAEMNLECAFDVYFSGDKCFGDED